MKFYRRAVCVVECDARILVLREENDDYWILPGGGVEEQETFLNACVREVKEELGLRVNSDQLDFLFILENFFHLVDVRIHELCVGFRLALESERELDLGYREEGIVREVCWVTREEFDELSFRPEALKRRLVGGEAFSYAIARDEAAESCR